MPKNTVWMHLDVYTRTIYTDLQVYHYCDCCEMIIAKTTTTTRFPAKNELPSKSHSSRRFSSNSPEPFEKLSSGLVPSLFVVTRHTRSRGRSRTIIAVAVAVDVIVIIFTRQTDYLHAGSRRTYTSDENKYSNSPLITGCTIIIILFLLPL